MLELRDVVVHRGQLPVLKGVSLTIEEGSIASLIGANGAGKSTLLRTISGILAPTSGSISFKGQRIDRCMPHEIVAMGIVLVPEGRQLFSSLTVEDNLKVGSYLPQARRVRDESIERAYEIFPRLRERRTQLARTLSGGEQQMLAIARALMARPRLLMLDEPSLGLAPVVVNNIFSTIREINRQGATILLVEQNVAHSLKISHQGFVIENGRIVLSGTGEALLKDEHTKEAYFGTYQETSGSGSR
ncbi:MAG: ABC transporter ATP-binding protein [candidate division WOR-3 bacterium]